MFTDAYRMLVPSPAGRIGLHPRSASIVMSIDVSLASLVKVRPSEHKLFTDASTSGQLSEALVVGSSCTAAKQGSATKSVSHGPA